VECQVSTVFPRPQPFWWHERNFQLRTLWVVTLCFPAGRRHLCLVAAVGQLCATTPLVSFIGPKRYWLRFAKPVRQFMRIETDCPS